ncbi:hypothetical protein AB1K83_03940 [Sporosarcina sp. 179-K 3D1 HS]|uniref:DUF2269 family protein n=1 Tax=Sporosarcina sp. 179-K 3D1 HS TaxID=3232169 RepID=UPI0039A2BC5B
MKVGVYSIFVYLHVFSAILSIGPLFVLMPIIRRLRKANPDAESAYLSIIRAIIRMVMHAGHMLVFTGTVLLIIGPWLWYTSWVVMTLAIMLLSAVFLAKGFTNVLKNFHQAADKHQVLSRLMTTSWMYIGLLLIMLWLMVQKPVIW